MTIETVQFYDTQLLCCVVNGEPMVAVRHMAEAIGLDADRALRTLQQHPILNRYLSEQTGEGKDGRLMQMYFLPIRRLPGWLLGVDLGKVKPAVQPRLLRFQEECYDVLYQHFFGSPGQALALNQEELALHREQQALRKELSHIRYRLRQISQELTELQLTRLGQGKLFPTAANA